MQEEYIEGSQLMAAEKWMAKIASWKSMAGTIKSEAAAVGAVKQALVDSARKRFPEKKFGILLSGGVDSSLLSLLAKQESRDFLCFTVGFQDGKFKEPDDLAEAANAASQIGAQLITKKVDLKETERIIKKTVNILGPELCNVVNVGVGAVEVACLEMCAKEGIDTCFSGLGSEEIFAGYHRHRQARDINEECWAGLAAMHERDLRRDCVISNHFGIKFFTPFLDEKLILTAMSIDGSQKIRGDETKFVLRKAAEELGLPKQFAWRPKKAAQYGSSMDRAIAKLAAKNGFTFKKDYLKSLI